LLFDLAADGLAVIMERAKNGGLIKGLVSDLVEGGLVLLQYADDTVFFIEDDIQSAQNLKFLLCIFEQMFGLTINYDKSEMFCFGDAVAKKDQYSLIFSCASGILPMKYLGIPVDQIRLQNKSWGKAEESMEGKLSCWQGKLMPIGGRLILIQSSLNNTPLYMMSFYPLPKGVKNFFDFFGACLLWGVLNTVCIDVFIHVL
jgi:hypothetical protein